MYYEVYVDTLFMINFMMDFLVLWSVGKILKQQTTWLRLMGASTIGGFMVCLIVIFPLRNILLNILLYYVITGLLMLYISYRPRGLRQYFKLFIALYLTTFLIGGAIVSLYYYTKVGYYFNQLMNGSIFEGLDILTLIFTSLMAFLIIKMIVHYFGKVVAMNKHLFPIEIQMQGKTIQAQGLLDTGNNLYDPITKTPVMIVEYDLIKRIVPESVNEILSKSLDKEVDSLYTHLTELCDYKFRLIPFNSIGKESGLLIGLVSESVSINLGEEVPLNMKDIVLAIYHKKLSQDNSYQILLHPEMIHSEI